MNATNTFQDGLVLDSHPLAVPNNVLTNCLNGTLITYNGNELILQNDIGNSKIIYKDKDNNEFEVKLTQGFVPVGMKSFNGIIYIFSYNESTKQGEIGTFPSPDYSNYIEDYSSKVIYNIHNVQYIYRPLKNLVDFNNNTIDFRTDKLNFDLQHPLTIDCQLSYDDSVNLIFNDDKNIPRLINTGFAPYGNNQVKIIKRDQKLETNLYDEENFEYTTSLVRVCNSIVEIKFEGELETGNLPVGNYVFYFKVADSDDNESDFIGQSGLVVCHKGKLNSPKSIDGGVVSENSNKTVIFKLSKIPKQFSRLYVYYSRYTSTAEGVLMTEYKKITKYFDLTSSKNDNNYREVTVNITGYDTTKDIGYTELNQLHINPLSAKAQALVDNRLILGNIKENSSLWVNLRNFSKNYVTVEASESSDESELLYDVNNNYENTFANSDYELYGYYNVKNIYNKVGYWPEEYYRFGIVYILDDYTTTPVFNIRGLCPYGDNKQYNDYGIIQFKKQYFKSFVKSNGQTIDNNTAYVLQFPKFKIDREHLPKGIIGCIFVRQKRIKNIIGQALQIGTDYKYTHIPVLWCGEERKWVTQSFVRNSLEIGQNNPYGQSTPSINPPEGAPTGHGITDEVYYYRHDYKPGTSMSFFNGPKDVKLGNSWIAHLQHSILGIFNGRTSPDNIPQYKIYKDAAIMPEFEVNQQFYSGVFTGGKLNTEEVVKFNTIRTNEKGINPGGHRNANNISTEGTNTVINPVLISPLDPVTGSNTKKEANIISVLENTTVKANDRVFKSVAGNASDPSIYITPFTDKVIINQEVPNVEESNDKKWYEAHGLTKDERKGLGNTDYMYHTRGIFSPYLGIATDNFEDFANYTLINIRTNKEANYKQLLDIRIQDYSEFYPISERIDFDNDDKSEFKCFRGDCYIGNFTHRMLRNFIDPEFPIQDEITQPYSWSLGNRIGPYDENDPDNEHCDDYDSGDEGDENHIRVLAKDTYTKSDKAKIWLNRADTNAVPLGQWITFKYYSSINPCMRSTDGSNILEKTTFNQPRKFYPLYTIGLTKNTNKLSDSYIYNEGYEQSVGQQIYKLFPEIPALKENYNNRILYSELNVDSLVTNNLRQFNSTSFRDYTRSYGSITKLVPWEESHLIIVFEHGVGAIQIPEKGVVSEVAKQSVYIDTTKVLGDLTMLSEQYGTQWPESVITTPTGVYGIDASAKKIWRYYTQFESISDLKISKFLKDNLVVSNISNQIDILNFNIKTHYNARKQDIMFTFYRNLEQGNMIAWNICYNEITKKMTTFYSWIPLYSVNINDTYYSLQFIPEMSSERLNYLLDPITQKYDVNKYTLYIWEHNKLNNWCNWYGEQHPFEFEYVVNANPNFQKIYNNLQLISNRTAPESFHFEIVGEGYDFSIDKKNMYYRQEATKAFYDWCLSRILENKNDYIQYDKEGVESIYLTDSLRQNRKSTIFPLKVKRLDFNNKLYDIYKQLTSNSYDYQSLSGSEIVYDATTNDYLIDTHIKAHPKGEYIWQTVCGIDDDNVNKIANYYVRRGIEIRINEGYLQKKVAYDQRLSNCYYNEDSWYVQIPSINYYEKNEDWSQFKNDGKSLSRPPLNVVTDPLPELLQEQQSIEINPEYPIDLNNWTTKKQTTIRDKYIKIKIRYTGDDFVVISGIINTFKESYN